MQICLRPQISQILRLSESFGEHSGDIPIYSLHKITKKLCKLEKIGISKDLQCILTRKILVANNKYKEESGNDWSCLTSQNLADAITWTHEDGICMIDNIVISQPEEVRAIVCELVLELKQELEKNIVIIRDWFVINHEDLLYDTSRKVPWVVVRRLRKDLSRFIVGSFNPFDEDIGEWINTIASEEGIKSSNPEDAWVKMGGKLSKK